MDASLRCLATVALWAAVSACTGCGVIADGHNRVGVRSVYRGDYQAGMESFRKAATRDAENSDAHYNMAATLHKLGTQSDNKQYLQQAEELYNQSLDYDETNTDSYRGLAVLLAQTQRSEKAFRLLRNWSTTNPTNPDAHTELARLYQEFGNIESAVQQLHEARRADPRDGRALTALAALREKQGDVRQALENYQRAYAVEPRPEVAARIAALNQSLGASTGVGTGAGLRTVNSGRTPRY